MERFQETLFVRFWVEADEIVVQIPNDRIITGSDVVEWWIFNHVSTVAHRIFDAFNRVAGCAGESGLGGGRMKILSDGFVHHAVEQDRWVVAAATPFRRLDAVDFLHIDNRLAIPLIVERGEMMGGFVPLLIDIWVAPFCSTGF